MLLKGVKLMILRRTVFRARGAKPERASQDVPDIIQYTTRSNYLHSTGDRHNLSPDLKGDSIELLYSTP